MKTIVFFSGLPGAGKSTICQRMAKMTGATYVDVDYYKKLRTDPNRVTEEVDPPDIRLIYCRDALNAAFDLFDGGKSMVAMDEVYPYRSVRAQLEASCTARGIRTLWVEVRTSPGVATERLSTGREGHLLHTPEIAANIHRMCADVFESFPADCSNHIAIYNLDGADLDHLAASIVCSI